MFAVIILPQHGEHYRMELFEADNFSGQCVELCDDCPFLQARGLTKSCVNSVKVYGDGAYVSLQQLVRAHKHQHMLEYSSLLHFIDGLL